MNAFERRATPPMPHGASARVLAAEHGRMQELLTEMDEVNRLSDAVTNRMLGMFRRKD